MKKVELTDDCYFLAKKMIALSKLCGDDVSVSGAVCMLTEIAALVLCSDVQLRYINEAGAVIHDKERSGDWILEYGMSSPARFVKRVPASASVSDPPKQQRNKTTALKADGPDDIARTIVFFAKRRGMDHIPAPTARGMWKCLLSLTGDNSVRWDGAHGVEASLAKIAPTIRQRANGRAQWGYDISGVQESVIREWSLMEELEAA